MATVRGGDKLRSALARIVQKAAKAKKVRVGFLEGSTDSEGVSNALKAVTLNFGAPARGIPPRPFFSNMILDNKAGWSKQIGTALKAFDYDSAKTLAFMGDEISAELKQSIVDTNEPPLKPATIKRKGSAKPLVDTGDMLAAVDFEVK